MKMKKNIRKLARQEGKTFYWGISILPKPMREAGFTIYSFIKHIEHVVYENNMTIDDKKDILETWLQEFYFIYDRKTPITEIGRMIYKSCIRFNLPKKEFLKILNGANTEIDTDNKPLSVDKYYEYCNDTSGAEINLALRIEGLKDEKSIEELSTTLGIALKTTKILNNIKEDAMMDKIFIPKEFLDEFNIVDKTPFKKISNINLYMARAKLGQIAKENFQKASDIMNQIDKKFKMTMIKITYNISIEQFKTMESRGWEIISPKVRINPLKKIFAICLGYLGILKK